MLFYKKSNNLLWPHYWRKTDILILKDTTEFRFSFEKEQRISILFISKVTLLPNALIFKDKKTVIFITIYELAENKSTSGISFKQIIITLVHVPFLQIFSTVASRIVSLKHFIPRRISGFPTKERIGKQAVKIIQYVLTSHSIWEINLY